MRMFCLTHPLNEYKLKEDRKKIALFFKLIFVYANECDKTFASSVNITTALFNKNYFKKKFLDKIKVVKANPMIEMCVY